MDVPSSASSASSPSSSSWPLSHAASASSASSDYRDMFRSFLPRTTAPNNLLTEFAAHADLVGFTAAKSVLSIGSGDGRMDFALTRIMPRLERYTMVEKNKLFLDYCKATSQSWTRRTQIVDTRAQALPFEPTDPWSSKVFTSGDRMHAKADIQFDFHLGTFDSFSVVAESDPSAHSYDVVLLLNVLYYVDFRPTLIQALRRAPLVVIAHNTRHGVMQVQREFGGHKERGEASSIASRPTGPPSPLYHLGHVEADLKGLGIHYRIVPVMGYVDVSDPPDELIRFFLESAHAPRTTIDDVKAWLRASVSSGAMFHPNAIVIVKRDDAAHLL